ncbi:discoidin domain-containing protein [Flavobacterium sp.]|uniref:discoidin domain-containing protein n=1 Tax=Flavobacterium sp. TaxID=239 RepID=UPI00334061E8
MPPSPVVTYNSPAIICGGSPIILSDNLSTNVSYQWFFNNNPINNATNNSYAATQSGTYKLVVSDLATGCSSTSQNVIVGEMPKIIPETIVTCGSSTTISLTNPNFNYSSLPSSCSVNMSSASIVTSTLNSSGGPKEIVCYGGIVNYGGGGGRTFLVNYGGTINRTGGGGSQIYYIKSGGIFNNSGAGGGSNILYYESGAIINSTAGMNTIVQCNNIGVIYPSNTTALCNNLTYLWSNGDTTPTITVNPSVSTTYSVTVSNGAVSCTDQVLVVPGLANPLPPTITASGPVALCQGESVVLTSSYPTGNVWSNGATTQSITVTQSGSYTVSYGSCSVTSLPQVVTVTTPPNNLTILSSGPTSFCEGGSVTLSLNSLSSVRYLKFESYYSSDSGQVNVHEIQAFSNGVNVALNKPGFANSYEYGNWANNGINAIDGNSGSRWSSNRNDPGPDINNPHYIVIDLESQFNLESILLDISSFQQTFSFKVSQDNINWIEIGSGNSVSGSFTYTPTLTNYSSYLWSNGATTPSITVSNSGAYSVTAYIGTTCSVVSNTLNVSVASALAPPTITTSGPTTINQGGSIELTSSYPTGNLWCNGATTQSITVSQIGSYSVSVSNGNCTSTSLPVVVAFNNTQTLPLLQNFEDPTTYTSVVGFEGAGAAIVSGIISCSATGNVLQGTQNMGGQIWQGIEFILTTKKAKLTSNKTMQVDVFANQALNILAKVEMGGPISANGQAYTTPGQWQTLTFDFSIPMDQTFVANGEYEKIIFFGNWNSTNTNFNSPPVALTYQIDNIRAEQVCLVAPAAPIVTYTSPAVICDGGSLTLTDNLSTNVSYQWYLNDSPISNATNNSYTATVPGTYKLVNTNLSSSCSSTSQNIIVGEMPKIVADTIVTCGNNTTISLTNSNFNFSTLPATCNIDMSSASILTTNQSGSESGHRKIICNGGIYTNNGNNNKYVVENGGTLNFNGGSGACVAYIKSGGTYNFISGDFPTITIYYEPGAIINAGMTQTIQCNNIGVIYPSNTTALCNNLTYLWSNGATTPTITVNPSIETTYTVTVSKGAVSCTDQVLVVPGVVNPLPPTITTSGPTALCQGESVVLTSSYPTGNVWSNGATTQSITVTQGGSYTVSYGSCLVTSLPKVVTVTTPPNSITILPSGPTTICQGSTVSLSLNSLSAIRYLKYECYSNPGGQARVAEIQVLSNGVNLALNKPGYASSYTGTGTWQTNGKNAVDGLSSTTWTSNSSSVPSTTNPQFIVIDLETSQVNIDSILLNIGSFTQTFSFKASQDNINWVEIGTGTSVSGSFTYTPTLTNYSSYLWSNGATTPSITVSESGVYSVTAFIGTTCSVTSNTIAVTANAVPTVPTISASGSTSLCQGESVVLTSSYPTGNTWSNGATTQSITVIQSGSYTVSVANSNCSSVSQPAVVTVTQVPSSINVIPSGPTTICAGSSVSLSLNSLSAIRYLKYECFYSGTNRARVAEIEAISNGVNVALNKPGYASSYITGTWLTNGTIAVDGNVNTVYLSSNVPVPSNSNPQYIVIDLETQYNLESILLNITSFTPQSFSFKVSPDNINWTEIGSGTSVSGSFTFTIPQDTINYSGYLWSNGATTPSITVTESGAYSVTAYIGSTCSVTSNTINVLVNPIPVTPTISALGPINICQGESVVLTSSYATGNLWSNGASSQSITVTQSGSYTVINGGCSAPSDPIVVAVASQTSTLSAPDNIVITTSPNQCVASNVNLGLPIGQSCTNYTITNNAPSNFPIGTTIVTWTLLNENGTTITANQNVTVNFNFDSTSICYVTSDETLTNRNRIYINNSNNNNVLEYQILKEVSTNVYDVIGSIPPNQNSYLDITSNNLTNSNKYKVNTVSICNSSDLNSTIHRTILLQSGLAVNNAVNLNWNPYEGISYGTFKIYRKIGSGNFELIDTISASNLMYNDINANTLTNTYEYYISIDVPACNSTPGGRTSETFTSNQLRSNILNTSSILGLSNQLLDLGVMIYPNPSSDILNIKIENTLTYLKTEIYNIIGQKVSESQKTNLDVSNLPNASYFVKIITEEGTASKTFIKK